MNQPRLDWFCTNVCSCYLCTMTGNTYNIGLDQVTISPRAGQELGYVRMKLVHIKFKEGMLRSGVRQVFFCSFV